MFGLKWWIAFVGPAFVAGMCGMWDAEDRTAEATQETVEALAANRVGERYLVDPAFRTDVLNRSLVSTKNDYAAVRLAKYTEESWGALPLWNPRTRPVRPEDLGARRPVPDETWTQFDPKRFSWDAENLRQLGEAVFFNYPIALRQYMFGPLKSRAEVERFGLWMTEERVGGLLWIEVPGGVFPAVTCATCHARTDENGDLIAGAPNHRLDNGAIIQRFARRRLPIGSWGPGRADINPDGIYNPSVIADLRPVRYQSHLQRSALLKNSIPALAVRMETGILTGGTAGRFRPPRKAMLALAYYVWGLADALPPVPEGRGRRVFDARCAGCHSGPGLNGAPLPIEKVDTNSDVVQSTSRHTGFMQMPSLRGVGSRERFFSGGQIGSFEQLLSAERPETGHRHGTDLSEKDKAALISFLTQL